MCQVASLTQLELWVAARRACAQRARRYRQADRGRLRSVTRRASTPELLGREKWSTPGLSVRLKWKQGMACQASTALLVRSSWFTSPSRVKKGVEASTT